MTGTARCRTSLPSALVTTGVTVALGPTVRNRVRSRVTSRAVAVSLTWTTEAPLPLRVTAAALEVSSTVISRSPGRMKWVKLRAVSNFVFVRTGHVSRVSSAVQLNGIWISPQLPPLADSPPGFMLS
ncbi:hypothetical protein SALBM217S_05727 [Streptomyces griseoloalbus]